MGETVAATRARIPAAVFDLALRLGAQAETRPASVKLRQIGRMKTRIDARSWMSFSAVQTISTVECGFDWRARLGPLGIVSARDALLDGQGRLDVSLLGLVPLVRAAHSPALVRGELMRYLAELAWAPDAILFNTALRWRIDNAGQFTVSAGEGETASEVRLTLDSEGRIAGMFAADRPRSASAPILPTPWRGSFSDYRRHAQRWLPFHGEVAWEIEGKEIVYWRGDIVRWALA